MTNPITNIKLQILELEQRIKKLYELVDVEVDTRQRDIYEGGILVLEDIVFDLHEKIRKEQTNTKEIHRLF